MLDSSALLAIFFREANQDQIRAAIGSAGVPVIGAANLAEVVMTSARRNPRAHTAVLKSLEAMGIETIPVDRALAYAAAEAKVRFPILNFGDTFCYALAQSRGLPILTTDADFLATDATLVPLVPLGGDID